MSGGKLGRMALVSEVVPVGPRILGCDTDTKLSRAAAGELAAANLAFVRRYLSLGAVASALDLDAVEVDNITSQNVAVMSVQHGRSSGWSEATGRVDGENAARHHLAASLPFDDSMGCDLEGLFSSKAQIIDYAGAWFDRAIAVGCTWLDAYIGSGVLLSSLELRQDLGFHLYWRSASDVPDVAVRGYAMIQLSPLDKVSIGETLVDLDAVQTDHLGNRHRWARRA